MMAKAAPHLAPWLSRATRADGRPAPGCRLDAPRPSHEESIALVRAAGCPPASSQVTSRAHPTARQRARGWPLAGAWPPSCGCWLPLLRACVCRSTGTSLPAGGHRPALAWVSGRLRMGLDSPSRRHLPSLARPCLCSSEGDSSVIRGHPPTRPSTRASPLRTGCAGLTGAQPHVPSSGNRFAAA